MESEMNKFGPGISEEMLNALVDKEYTPAEQVEKLSQVKQDKFASAELCRLRELKESVRLAYAAPPQPKRDLRIKKSSRFPVAIAVTLVLIAVGILQFQNLIPLQSLSNGERFVLLDPVDQEDRPAIVSDKSMRVVFHVQNLDRISPVELLDEVESLLQDFQGRGEALRVEVVAHGNGLGLLRSKLSIEKQRISQMVKRYPTLTFVACRNTIQRLKVEKGIEVLLLPEATTTESAVAHVVRRQNQGWIYIQV
jgi:intracellular sulfur oxidation DsrE/DsrF family protein